jgi:hypothetical protein
MSFDQKLASGNICHCDRQKNKQYHGTNLKGAQQKISSRRNGSGETNPTNLVQC